MKSIMLMILLLIMTSTITVTKENTDYKIDELLYYGTLAPSSHNAQMWKVKKIQENEFVIILDKERNLNMIDPDYKESFISIGAFLANIKEGAKILNLDIEYTIYDELKEDNSIIHVIVNLDNEKKLDNKQIEELKNNLLNRKTAKEKFIDKKIDITTIEKITKGYTQNIMYYPKDSKGYKYINDKAVEAYTQQGSDIEKRKELSAWLRFSNKEVKEKRDGLSAEMLGLNSFKKFFYYIFYNREKAENINFLKEELKILNKQLESSSGFLVIYNKDELPKTNIESGIILEKIWLNATKENIKVQPISQILEEVPFKDDISKDLNINGEVKMILRIGYSNKNNKVKKIRRSVEDITIK